MVRGFAGLALLICLCAAAHAADSCGPDRYFAPDDPDLRRPLRAPHADFQNTLERANAGNAVQQRNLGVYYDAGYLVSKCQERAAQWYAKAAASGDAKAQAWVARHQGFERMRVAAPCAGAACPGVAGIEPLVELYSDGRGHFVVPVTINGVTVNGLVDTGATGVSITTAVARQMGVAYERGRPVTINTANGTKAGVRVTFDSVRVGGIVLEYVDGVVSDGGPPMLLGMSFLRRLKMNASDGRMTLTRP